MGVLQLGRFSPNNRRETQVHVEAQATDLQKRAHMAPLGVNAVMPYISRCSPALSPPRIT
jgi:hypothetical protein